MQTINARTIGFFCLSIWLSLAAIAIEKTEPVESSVGTRVAEMFNVGVPGNPRASQESKRLHDLISDESDHDPRIDYAYGLVLLRLLKTKDAREQFVTATKRPGVIYRPAWRAMIWSHFNGKDSQDGYAWLVEYAKRIRDPELLPDDARHDEAYWIGRVMSAEEILLESPDARELWMRAEKKLTDLLGVKNLDAYNDGKKDVHIHHAMIEDKILRDHERTEELKAQKREKELERKEKLLDAVKETREDLKKSVAETKENFEGQTSAYQNQIQRVEKDFAFLERRAFVLTNEMLLLDQQIIAVEQAGKNPNVKQSLNYAQRLNALQNQRYLKGLEFQRVSAFAQEVSLNGRQLAEQRANSIDQFQQTAEELAQRDAANEKIKDRTLRQVAGLTKGESVGKVPAVVSKLIAARSFRSYIDFDLPTERDQILSSFGVKD